MTTNTPPKLDLLVALGKAAMRCEQQAERIRELEQLVDQLRLDLHHMEIHAQGLTDENTHAKARLAALMEKAETVKVQALQASILDVDEFDLRDEFSAIEPTQIIRPFSVPHRRNPPLVL